MGVGWIFFPWVGLVGLVDRNNGCIVFLTTTSFFGFVGYVVKLVNMHDTSVTQPMAKL